jgi:hypothetical protein
LPLSVILISLDLWKVINQSIMQFKHWSQSSMLIDKDHCQAPRQEINNWMTELNILSTLQPIKFETDKIYSNSAGKRIFGTSWGLQPWSPDPNQPLPKPCNQISSQFHLLTVWAWILLPTYNQRRCQCCFLKKYLFI